MCKVTNNIGLLPEICQMKILVTAATDLEILPFIKNNNNVEIFIHGVGSMHATYRLSQKLNTSYQLVIQAGIAGRFNQNVQLGQTVLIQKDCFADIGILHRGNLSTIFEMGLADENEFPYQNALLENKHPLLQSLNFQNVNAVTVNLLNTDKTYIQQLKQKYHADVESMEGAAFHYVCLQRQIPFLQLRSISNDVGERDKALWKMDEAIQNLYVALEKIILFLTKNER